MIGNDRRPGGVGARQTGGRTAVNTAGAGPAEAQKQASVRHAACAGSGGNTFPTRRITMLDIIRRDPVGRSVRDLLSFVADDPFFRTPLFKNGAAGEGTLALDIVEGDGELIVKASVPGFKKEDIDVQIHEGVLTIRAERSEEQEREDERFYRRERRTGSVSRRVALPAEIADTDATAVLEDGVLTLRIPQAEAAKPKQIPIN
jgi:HSP20 family protein